MVKEDIYSLVSNNIKKYRRIKNMTIMDLSKKTGYSYAYLRRIEMKKYKKGFSIQTIYVISKCLNIDIKCLFEDDDI